MKRGAVLWMAVGLCCASGIGGTARAQDASFGCKVLLCAAASVPGWSGIPYCVPVMQTLFRQLAKGGGWPSCPEGNASGVGYEPYQACPAGLTPVQSAPDGVLGLSAAPNGDLCADLSKPQQVCADGDGGCSTTYPTTARDPRSDPYYVDISSANGSQRFYFSLRGY
ncbi:MULTISPECIES: hypothetical protein [Nitrobacteraceae]|jgi:hypothetical protein|uniref:Uncharacterized protein n=1 Tax=Rhodopseudomonas palustris TaxID=1076 RepID=A0A0D7F1N8_RHOPL|nr:MULTISPECIES: hypothetical protein [Nitrobacteraceae]MCW5703805.1 hypothetical protein [Bradyrhizobium sp.]KIZ46700.1 hypothetical protein OO17_06340 [Rhodopseudomonas palustris]KQW18085.1 hypothetical protein ASC80_21870 [Afipia sp. Root123D2]MDF3811991.1 hypothetical protein [Rhodopseudomonas sp. BAL398]WOK21057.1 hypothetical protein RBJ75_29165 [Rhodopseudomonas sp. BAL398]